MPRWEPLFIAGLICCGSVLCASDLRADPAQAADAATDTVQAAAEQVEETAADEIPPGTVLHGKWIVVQPRTQGARRLKTTKNTVVWVVPAPVVLPGATSSGPTPQRARVSALIPMPNRGARSPAGGISLSGDGLGKNNLPLFGQGSGRARRSAWKEAARQAAIAIGVGTGIAVAFVAVLYLILLVTAGLAAIAEARAHRSAPTIVHEFDIDD